MRIVCSLLWGSVFAGAAFCAQGDWPAYGYDQGGQRYSPLSQIDIKNVSKLKLAWQYGIAPGGVDLRPR